MPRIMPSSCSSTLRISSKLSRWLARKARTCEMAYRAFSSRCGRQSRSSQGGVNGGLAGSGPITSVDGAGSVAAGCSASILRRFS